MVADRQKQDEKKSGMSIEDLEASLLHNDVTITSGKQVSAQGSVFYVKKRESKQNNEYVLKIYKNADLKSYTKEMKVFEAI